MFLWVLVANGSPMLLNTAEIKSLIEVDASRDPRWCTSTRLTHIERTEGGPDLEVVWPPFAEIVQMLPTLNQPPPQDVRSSVANWAREREGE